MTRILTLAAAVSVLTLASCAHSGKKGGSCCSVGADKKAKKECCDSADKAKKDCESCDAGAAAKKKKA